MNLQLYQHAGCKIWVWVLTETDTVESIRARLDYPVDLDGMKAESRQREILGIRLIVQHLYGVNERIGYDSQHRPYLKEHQDFISIAHSHGILALAVHHTRPIGMDLEVFGKKMRRVRSIFLNAHELAWQSPNDDTYTSEHLCWTVKEALYKLLGSPVYDFPNAISIEPPENAVSNPSEGELRAVADGRNCLLHYWIREHYVLTITNAS